MDRSWCPWRQSTRLNSIKKSKQCQYLLLVKRDIFGGNLVVRTFDRVKSQYNEKTWKSWKSKREFRHKISSWGSWSLRRRIRVRLLIFSKKGLRPTFRRQLGLTCLTSFVSKTRQPVLFSTKNHFQNK